MLKKVASLALLALAACSPTPQSTTAATSTTTARVTETSATGATTLRVVAPAANARITSPFVSTGVAPSNWFFEAQFHAELIGADGKTIVEAPAMALEDWTNGNSTHPFRAELAFSVAADTPATLLLREDMPPDDDHPDSRPTREIRIPVTLAAH